MGNSQTNYQSPFRVRQFPTAGDPPTGQAHQLPMTKFHDTTLDLTS